MTGMIFVQPIALLLRRLAQTNPPAWWKASIFKRGSVSPSKTPIDKSVVIRCFWKSRLQWRRPKNTSSIFYSTLFTGAAYSIYSLPHLVGLKLNHLISFFPTTVHDVPSVGKALPTNLSDEQRQIQKNILENSCSRMIMYTEQGLGFLAL